MKTNLNRILYLIAALGLAAGMFGCSGGSGSGDDMATYEVKLTNLTANQPLSPPAAILHGEGYSAWQFGAAVSDGLEQLAESGSPVAFLAEAGTSTVVRDSQAGSGVVLPGDSAAVTLAGASADARLTLATMLVNTNDGFTGIDNQSLANLQPGQTLTLDVRTYDAGTEANSETLASVPGPAAGGEGFNLIRDDRGFVTVHSGVISADDGLLSSVLNESHRIQNPAARLVITRIQ